LASRPIWKLTRKGATSWHLVTKHYLSAAFDTVASEQLSPTLQALRVTGREVRWFLCFMTGGRQSVVWDGMVSTLINVLYGVCQGSILGPLLFIILVSGMAKFLGV
jgi:hypothetical protein